MMQNEIRYIDLFGGVGGFSLGLQRASDALELRRCGQTKANMETNSSNTISQSNKRQPTYRCVGYYEIDKHAVQTYNKNFGTNYNPTDITKLRVEDIPNHDLICAGFPCQSFSIAGKRRGFQDTRGTLFFEIVRIAKHHKPRYLFLENVKGLLSHNNGRTFGKIIATLDELGYDVQWQVLNSKDFGVPQNRERVFIIGHLRGKPRFQVFPIGEGNETLNGFRNENNNTGRDSGNGQSKDRRASERREVFNVSSSGRGYIQKGRVDKRMTETNTALTLTVLQDNVRSGTYEMVGNRIRRLTPIECSRLQSFPDSWNKYGIKYLNPETYNKDYVNAKKKNTLKI